MSMLMVFAYIMTGFITLAGVYSIRKEWLYNKRCKEHVEAMERIKLKGDPDS